MIPWLHLVTALIGAKVMYAISSLFMKSLCSVWRENIGIETVTQKEIASVRDELLLTNQERAGG